MIDYTTVATPSTEVSQGLERALADVERGLGQRHPLDLPLTGRTREWVSQFAPADPSVEIGAFEQPGAEDVDAAVERARDAFAEWSHRRLEDRAAILRRAADLIEERRFELTAIVVREVGKSRLEALAEVDEASVLLRLYCQGMEDADGFRTKMNPSGANEENLSLMRPYGPWLVISPFNFPLALAVGPAAAALVTGNTVILKPSPNGQLTATVFREIMVEAGLPSAAIQVLPGSPEIGALLAGHPGVAGVTFTGSHRVGLQLIQQIAPSMKPVICEMGGKNPAIVTGSANMEDAVDGVARAAFGFSGQKCSACSRVYVEEGVFDAFCEGLAQATEELTVGDPAAEDCFTGPLINASAVERFERVLAEAREAGGTVLAGGQVADDAPGYFAAPSVVVGAPSFRTLWQEELFVPLVAVTTFRRFDEALAAANSSDYALTAGIYSEEEDEIQLFLDRAEASVLYCNRRGGATTGAWPGSQPISGWKASGNTGRGTGGPHYLQQYMREQSQTVARR